MDFGEDIGAVYKVRAVAHDPFGNRALDSIYVVVMPEVQVVLDPPEISPHLPGTARYPETRDTTTLRITVRHPRTHRGIPGVPLEILLKGIPRTGGHNHDPLPPLGGWVTGTTPVEIFSRGDTLRGVRAATDTAGRFEIRYESGEVSGLRLVEVRLGRRRDTATTPFAIRETLRVRVEGLAELGPGRGYALVGETAAHPQNHYGHPFLRNWIRHLAQRAQEEMGEFLYINDMSLEGGGLFDVCGTFNPSTSCLSSAGLPVSGHVQHRWGDQVDLTATHARGEGPAHSRFVEMMKRVAQDLFGRNSAVYYRYHARHYHVTVVPANPATGR